MLTGVLYDSTGDYAIAFWLVGGLFAISVILLSLVSKRLQHEPQGQSEHEQSKQSTAEVRRP